MSRYEKVWPCCGDITITDAWEPVICPFCPPYPSQTAPSPVEEEAEGARQVVQVYDKLHEGKLGAHWLWVVIEQIAAGIPEDEAMRAFGYYEPGSAPAPAEDKDGRDAARFRAIECSGHSGTIRIDDELALLPRYIHWGGTTGLDFGAAIDRALAQQGAQP